MTLVRFSLVRLLFWSIARRRSVLEKNEQKELLVESSELEVTNAAGKKAFVEPELSVPVDVLEATTFLQAVTSGSTN